MRRLFVILATLFVLPLAAQNEDDARQFQKLAQVFRYLSGLYVDEVEMKPVVEGAITGMLEELDPHSAYIGAEEMKGVQESFDGEFSGIGVEFNVLRDTVIVVNTIAGGPAERVGVRANDRIVRIDTLDAVGMSRTDVPKHLRGKTGTKVGIDVVRHGTPGRLHFVIVRDKIPLNTVDASYLAGEGIGYIKVNRFGRTTMDEFTEAYRKLGRPEGLILDLRGNGGGLLDEAIKILGFFLPKGTEVLTTKGRTTKDYRVYKTSEQPIMPDMPLAVLIDGGSASASEITAGALQDLDRAVIIGGRSFGKGLVQTTRPLPFNSLLKLTIAKYYIPSGRLIQEIDYSHRNPDGTFKHKPDSLCNVFHTAHGREVRDGGGITPDIKVTFPEVNRLVYNIVRDQWAFDYATKYAAEHPTIAPAGEFEITDEIFNDFKKFIDPNKFQYDKLCETGVSLLRKTAETEGYMTDSVKAEFDKLEKMLKHDLNHDLDRNRKEISRQLSSEIVKRYYYDAGECENELKFHKAMDEAVAMFNKPGEYKKILRK